MNLPKNYEPAAYEKDIYDLWEKSGAFKPTLPGSKGKTYSIVMPPPNANAGLHIGYELTAALEDIATRYHRLKGESTVLVPGADHAGFETWVVYEKKLNKEGKTRFDFTREELYAQVWDFVEHNKNTFMEQMRLMGVSCDWDRFTFTLDPKVIKQAYATFKQMWHDKLIYRGERLVNFCTFHGTSFSDIEVVYKTEPGKLWYFDYPLEDGSGKLTVATTRPETMLGDTAVAVNPKDARYKKFVGKTVVLPITGREVPVLADQMVDMKFGTGAVKITPAHDVNDYEVAERHSLPMISVINTHGLMSDTVPADYRGLSVEEARKKVVKDLKEQGVLVKEVAHSHRVGHCYKCGTVIQPLLRDQWFVSMKPLAEKAVSELEKGKITFYPTGKLAQSIEYLKNIRDWNISRQIAWGIPIPAFQNVDEPDDWIYDERVDQETITLNGRTYRRDPDVFDTWFSSGQWPFITLDYPEGEDFKYYYPLSLMETGGEILYPWVCRMIMLGLYVTGDIPFEEVYIHGYVMAEDGSKMSKSLGNVVDPIPTIKNYGSDAMRMGIISGRVAGVNRGFDLRKVKEARNFGNKLWNIARFAEFNIGDGFDLKSNPKAASSQDEWILSRVSEVSEKVSQDLEKYRFNDAYESIYHLVWDDLADWYVEVSKHELNRGVLAYVLESVLKITHPFAPFITETIWQTLKWSDNDLLINNSWPKALTTDKSKVKDFEKVQTVVEEIRFIKGVLGTNSKVKLAYKDNAFVKMHAEIIKSMAALESAEEKSIDGGLPLSSVENSYLDLDNKTIDKFLSELKNQKKQLSSTVSHLKERLANKSYVANAPKSVVTETKEQLEATEKSLTKLDLQYKQFTEK